MNWPLKKKYREFKGSSSQPYSARTNPPNKNKKHVKHPIGFSGRTLALKRKNR